MPQRQNPAYTLRSPINRNAQSKKKIKTVSLFPAIDFHSASYQPSFSHSGPRMSVYVTWFHSESARTCFDQDILLVGPVLSFLLNIYLFSWLPCSSDGKESASNAGDWVQSLGWKDPLKKGMATHSNILAWRIPWTEERGGLQSMRSHRVQT